MSTDSRFLSKKNESVFFFEFVDSSSKYLYLCLSICEYINKWEYDISHIVSTPFHTLHTLFPFLMEVMKTFSKLRKINLSLKIHSKEKKFKRFRKTWMLIVIMVYIFLRQIMFFPTRLSPHFLYQVHEHGRMFVVRPLQ